MSYSTGGTAVLMGEITGRSLILLIMISSPALLRPKDQPIAYRILKPESGREQKDSAPKFGKAYVNGNIMEGSDAVTKDNWSGGVQVGDLARCRKVPG
jgi:hypothetical protein